MEMPEREQRLWSRIEGARAAYGEPRALCSALTPFPFWALIAAIVIFLPLALLLSFFVRRHAILVQGDELVVLDLSFWRYAVRDTRLQVPLGSAAAALEGGRLTVGGASYHLEPGWSPSASRLVELDRGGPVAADGAASGMGR